MKNGKAKVKALAYMQMMIPFLPFFAAIEAPEFDTPHLDNHTVQLGATAFLPCTIKNLGNKSVGSKVLIIYLA